MKCADCHKDRVTIAILEPKARHERRVCLECLLTKYLKTYKGFFVMEEQGEVKHEKHNGNNH